jgi:hypothetical protein
MVDDCDAELKALLAEIHAIADAKPPNGVPLAELHKVVGSVEAAIIGLPEGSSDEGSSDWSEDEPEEDAEPEEDEDEDFQRSRGRRRGSGKWVLPGRGRTGRSSRGRGTGGRRSRSGWVRSGFRNPDQTRAARAAAKQKK